ncbi:hypothetical protein FQN53_002136 [Emmonsiellopsis sp. PD_33]|nr:hypothetical protein FQN53_002136 [Emmonsiellopsis sp. PD_33]
MPGSKEPGQGMTIDWTVASGTCYLAPRFYAIKKPTLILCLANIIDVWISELDKYFPGTLTVQVFHWDKSQTSDPARKDVTLGPNELGPFLKQTQDTGRAAHTIIISSYNTWAEPIFRVRDIRSDHMFRSSVADYR